MAVVQLQKCCLTHCHREQAPSHIMQISVIPENNKGAAMPAIRIGINPISWSNDDLPALGGETP